MELVSTILGSLCYKQMKYTSVQSVHASMLGFSVAQWLGRRTSDPAVLGSIPRLRIIRHLGQLSLPSLRGR